jgi:hypothetical protein
MRKWLVGVIAAGTLQCLVPAIAAAQSWSLPVRAGWSRAGVSGDQQLGSDFVNGFVGSVGAALRLNEEVSVEFDVAYAQKGGKGVISNEVAYNPSNPPPPGPQITIVGETNLDYVEFWATVAGHLQLRGESELKGYLGISLGNLVNAEAKGTNNGQPFETDLKDGLSSIDWAGLFGLAYTYDFERVTIMADLIAEIGFTNINDSVLDVDFKTRAYYVMLGVAFPLTQ